MSTEIKWHTEKRKLADLKEWQINPRTISEEEYKNLKLSIDKLGNWDSLVINTDGTVIAGNQRLKIHRENGDVEVEVKVPERQLSEEEMKEIGLKSNRHSGEWDYEKLVYDFEETINNVGLDDLLKIEQPLIKRKTKTKPFKKFHILLTTDIENAEYLQKKLNSIQLDNVSIYSSGS